MGKPRGCVGRVLLAEGEEAEQAEDGDLLTTVGHGEDEFHVFLPQVFGYLATDGE